MPEFADSLSQSFRKVQDHICAFLTAEDGSAYREDVWEYGAGGGAGKGSGGSGGGVTRIWEDGLLLEKGGIGFSAIRGASLPAAASTQLRIEPGTPFFATGVSLVLHPRNPHVPTVHMNVRYFEAGEARWFGGGIDLTPYYADVSRVAEYHRALRTFCVDHGRDYEEYKRACDEYFFLKHRGEARGVGGLFFDHLHTEPARDAAFVEALGWSFPDIYKPFLAGRDKPCSERQRWFQLYRRSRYVEFNLLYDRGTLFGLQSNGRAESILMSMPPLVKWAYDWRPEPGSEEEKLTEFFLKPQDWAGAPQPG